MTRMRFALMQMLVITCGCLLPSLHSPRIISPGRRSMRSRHGINAMSSDDTSSPLNKIFGLNRDTPEAKANQLKWAREQMAMEVPNATVGGEGIADRDDFVRQYIASEKERYDRDIDVATAEREVDAWLLKQATAATSKTTSTDLIVSVLVFAAAFGSGLYFSGGSS